MTWNNTSPGLANSIAEDIADILENFQNAHDASGNVDKVLAGANGGIDANGKEIYLDADNDSNIAAATDDVITMDVGGAEGFNLGANGLTLPLQPAFLVRPTAEQSNIAQDSYQTVVFGTEVVDRGSNFAANTFTAPVTGLYQLNVGLQLKTVSDGCTSLKVRLDLSNRDFVQEFIPSNLLAAPTDAFYVSFSVLADMDAADTANVDIYYTGGNANMDITAESHFSGFLVA